MKRGMTVMPIVGLIIIIVGLAVTIGFLYTVKEEAFSCNLNQEAINTWVIKAGTVQETTGGFMPSSYPPVSNLCDVFQVDSKDDFVRQGNKQPVLYNTLANTMIDCWNAFGKGEIDFSNRFEDGKKFCFPCRAFVFSDDIKREAPTLQGFNDFLKTNKPYAGENMPTYEELLLTPDQQAFTQITSSEEIKVDDDLYVIFYAANRGTWKETLSTTAKGAAEGGVAGTFVLGLAGTIGGAVIGGGVALTEQVFFSDETFNPTLLIAKPRQVLELCNT